MQQWASQSWRVVGVSAVVVLAFTLACRETARETPRDTVSDSARATADVAIRVRTGVITAPDSASAGWTRVRVDEDDDHHIIVAFQLPAASSDEQIAAFVAALDASPATPSPGVAMGGPEIGAHGEVLMNLSPGVSVLACVSRGDDGHRHAIRGESKVLRVTARATETAADTTPRGTQDVRLIDFAFMGPDHWAAGKQLLRIENTGKQDHQLRLERLRDGVTLQQWMQTEAQETVATPIAGMARLGPGQTAYLPVTLTAGTYVAYCLVSDPATKQQHVMLGMMRAIQVP